MPLDEQNSPPSVPPHRQGTEKAIKGVLLVAAVVGGIPLLLFAFIIAAVAMSG
ncbi:hypothetical protein ACFYWU_32090 [Streptomyces chrestomyceticus]|uniref:hypothetical protein n=1 Tax=Streptomyces chrestomyceticus TaxID=68185 RepID=UPI0019D05798|nr:hypothetical protein [Streptomyces chrestomyceticus]